jgi:acyl-CoA synthetase (NDP forming)
MSPQDSTLTLDQFFAPRSVAVVGASADTTKLGYAVLNNVVEHGFTGAVYPINPKVDQILGPPGLRQPDWPCRATSTWR